MCRSRCVYSCRMQAICPGATEYMLVLYKYIQMSMVCIVSCHLMIVVLFIEIKHVLLYPCIKLPTLFPIILN